jgi:hypothetical protein
MDEHVDEFLEHFGVKGMKWGVRKRRDSSPGSSDYERASAAKNVAKTKGTKALSNEELQALVNRMNLEQQYSRLQGPSAGTQFRRGATKFVVSTIADIGKQQIRNLASQAVTDAVKKAMP